MGFDLLQWTCLYYNVVVRRDSEKKPIKRLLCHQKRISEKFEFKT